MRIRLALLLAAVIGSWAMPVSAEMKIAVINAQRAVLESKQGQAFLAELQGLTKADEEQIRALNGKIAEVQQRLMKDGEVMSEAERRRVEKEAQDLVFNRQQVGERIQKIQKDRLDAFQEDMAPKLQAVLEDLIKVEAYDMVMDRQLLRYVNPRHDISAKVTEKLNAAAN